MPTKHPSQNSVKPEDAAEGADPARQRSIKKPNNALGNRCISCWRAS